MDAQTYLRRNIYRLLDLPLMLPLIAAAHDKLWPEDGWLSDEEFEAALDADEQADLDATRSAIEAAPQHSPLAAQSLRIITAMFMLASPDAPADQDEAQRQIVEALPKYLDEYVRNGPAWRRDPRDMQRYLVR